MRMKIANILFRITISMLFVLTFFISLYFYYSHESSIFVVPAVMSFVGIVCVNTELARPPFGYGSWDEYEGIRK